MSSKTQTPGIRTFNTGANRNVDTGKFDFDGFVSPLFLEAFGTYMNFNRHLEDGTLRDSDNWQLGIPTDVCRKSMWRHHLDAWRALRNYSIQENVIWALCGLAFNVQCIVHNLLKDNPALLGKCLADMEQKRAKMWAAKKIKGKK